MIGISELTPPHPGQLMINTHKLSGLEQWASEATWADDSADCNFGKTNTSLKRAEKSAQGWLTKYREANIDVRRKMLGWRPLTSGEKMLLT